MRIIVEGHHGHYSVKREGETGVEPSWLSKFQGKPIWVVAGERLLFAQASIALRTAAELMERLEKAQPPTGAGTRMAPDFTKMVIKVGDRLRVTESLNIDYVDDHDIQQEVEVPEGTIITVAQIVDNDDEFTICFVYQGHELMSPSDCFVRHGP